MTLPVVWIAEADADLKAALAWYEDIRSELGVRFAQAVESAVEAIAENPLTAAACERERKTIGRRSTPINADENTGAIGVHQRLSAAIMIFSQLLTVAALYYRRMRFSQFSQMGPARERKRCPPSRTWNSTSSQRSRKRRAYGSVRSAG